MDVNSLRAITGQVDCSLVIFTEDDFAAEWIRTIIRSSNSLHFESTEVHGMAGDGTAVAVNDYHNADPSSLAKSMCIIDGDSQHQPCNDRRIYRLPGQMPESYICQTVMGKFDEIGSQLTLALHKRFEDTEAVRSAIKQVLLTCMDAHLLYAQIGKAIGFIPETTVRNAFLTQWVIAEPVHTKAIETYILSAMPGE